MPAATTTKILCAVDFSAGSERALDKAIELARALGGELELLHVYPTPAFALPDMPLATSSTFAAELGSQMRKLLDDALLRLQAQAPDLRVSAHLAQGSPAEGIVQHAQHVGASLIVLGTHGRSGFKRFLLGSVAERVVRTSGLPVLTVQLTSALQDRAHPHAQG